MELIHECLANMHLRRFDWGEIDGKVFVSLNVIDLIQPESKLRIQVSSWP